MSGTPTSGNNYPTVVELVDGYQFNITSETSTATRVFTTAVPSGATTLTLPAIGSSYSSDWPNLTLKSISHTIMGPNPNCPRKFTCTYDTRPCPTMELLVDPRPTISMEISADYLTYTNSTSSGSGDTLWRWNVGGTITNAPDIIIPKIEYHATLTTTRYLYRDTLDDWFGVSNPRIGTVNKTEITYFTGWPAETLLYTGAQVAPVTSENNNKMWRAEMKFSGRIVYNPSDTTHSTPLGWNYVFDVADNTYKRLCQDGDLSKPLYQSWELMDLFKTCKPLFLQNNPNLPH